MRIIVISSQIFPLPIAGYGGLEQIAYECAKGLAARGHEVAVVAPDGSNVPGCQMVYSGPAGTWDEQAAYSRYWQQLPWAECIIDHSWQKWPLSLKEEGKLAAPSLSVMHSIVNNLFANGVPAFKIKPCWTAISEDQGAHFRALWNLDCRVCHNGVDLDFYKPLGVPRSKRFLALGRFSSIKGFDLAIDACEKAGAGLDLVGDNKITEEPEYYKKVADRCDGERIRMVGHVNRGEAVWWFSQAHALVHANKRFREPFGLAPVEAMACGCPFISWDYGAMRETAMWSGQLVNSEDRLNLAVDEIYRNGYEANVRKQVVEHAKKFSIQNMVRRYEQLCEEAVKTGGW